MKKHATKIGNVKVEHVLQQMKTKIKMIKNLKSNSNVKIRNQMKTYVNKEMNASLDYVPGIWLLVLAKQFHLKIMISIRSTASLKERTF